MKENKEQKNVPMFLIGTITGVLPLLLILLLHFMESTYIKSFTLIEILILILQIFLILLIYIRHKKLFKYEITAMELARERSIKESLFQLNHEIKNPLAVINGYLEMIERTSSTEKKEKYLNIIREEVKRSINIINDFSSLGRIKKLDLEPLDLSMIFEDISDILTPLVNKRNGEINYHNFDELYTMGDYNRLKQVFINIIKNSIESQDKESIIIDIDITREKNNYIVKIRDNGKGMNSDTLNHIEENFFSTKKNGSGIGLGYARKIIEMHNGNLKFESKEKEGTTAVVTLPLLN